MVVVCGNPIELKRCLHIGIGADAALELEAKLEDRANMAFLRRCLKMLIGQFRACRKSGATILRIDQAETVIGNYMALFSQWAENGDGVGEMASTRRLDAGNKAPWDGLSGRAVMLSAIAGVVNAASAVSTRMAARYQRSAGCLPLLWDAWAIRMLAIVTVISCLLTLGRRWSAVQCS